MKSSILSSLDSLPYFTIEAVRQLDGGEGLIDGSVRTALYRWMKSGKVIQLKKGVYMTWRFYEQHRADADFAPMISHVLIPQSYLSLEYVLQRNGILTDVTYPVTAVTLKHTRVIENIAGVYQFRNIKEPLYSGFTILNYMGIPFAVASRAKALFDFLYLRHWGEELYDPAFNLVESLRLNLDEFSNEDQSEFMGYIESSGDKKMSLVYRNISERIWRH